MQLLGWDFFDRLAVIKGHYRTNVLNYFSILVFWSIYDKKEGKNSKHTNEGGNL
jgi:hypothetical protein